MSYVEVEENGDFVFFAKDKTPLAIGNKGTKDYPFIYKVSVLNTACVSDYYFGLVKDFFSEYFDIKAILALGRYSRNENMFPYDHDFIAVLINPFWKVMETFTIDKALKIIDDATCHGFEFKVENGEVYFREIMNSL